MLRLMFRRDFSHEFSALNVCLLICLNSDGTKEEADGEKGQAE
jgi:hypothetical protein